MRSQHKKLTFEDKFAREYYTRNAALRLKRTEKKYNNKKIRRLSKKLIENY